MTYRLSVAQLRADFALLGSRAAIARKYGVSEEVITRRAPELKSARPVGRIQDPLRRAAFLHAAGMTLDEASAATGVGIKGLVLAIRSHHARQQARRSLARSEG